MRTYTRAKIPGACYFFTVVAADRQTDLFTRHIDLLRSAFRNVRRAHPFLIDAAVVLPDHLHCLWTLPEGDEAFPTRWRLIKSGFSRSLAAGEAVSASRLRKGERGIWQRRYWEHLIRDEPDYQRHIDYIHFNAVKHGYAKHPGEWPHSSFRRFVRRGLYPPEWGAPPDVRALDFE